MDPSILRSLQEIASLLLLVHDDYLRDVFGNDVLASLTLLLRDVGLSGVVSVLDSERLRSIVMGGSDGDMGYELFYDWLRGVGQLVYKGRDQTGKAALHFLLTRYVIPFVSKTDATSGESDTVIKVELPYFTDAALKVLVDYSNFVLLLFSEIALEYPASVLACNMNLWQQISSSTSKGNVSLLSVLGVFTKYSVVPDLLTEDEFESTMMLASSSSDASTDTIQFPTFLYLLELVAETLSEAKLVKHCSNNAVTGGTETSRKLANLLCILGMNMMQRKAFKFMSLDEGAGGSTDVTVFEEEALHRGNLTSSAVLWWLRQSGAVTLPHIQIPTILVHLNAQSPAGDRSAEEMHSAAGIEKVIYTTLHLLSNGRTTNTPASNHDNTSTSKLVDHLMKQLPALFFADMDLQAPANSVQAALRCLYSPHTAPLLRDSASELEASMIAMWIALTAMQTSDAESLNISCPQTFAERFGSATVRIHTLLEFLAGKGLVPAVLNNDAVMNICGAVMVEQASAFTEESIVLQARLFEVLYVIAHEHWSSLENTRRRRPAGTSGLRLSARQPQRAQQIFQTFLFLMHYEAPAATEAPTTLTESVRAALDQASKPALSPLPAPRDLAMQSVEGRITGIPVPVASKRPLPALDTNTCDAADLPVMTPLTASVKQLTVSFNSHKRVDGSPVTTTHQRGAGSLFASHPLRDIAVLLLHYPLSSFSLNPWSVTHLLLAQADNLSAQQGRQGIAEENASSGDRQLTDLLRKFCAEYGVSSVHLSEYFALYYLPVDGSRETTPDGVSTASSTLFKEQALRSEVIDLLMGKQALRILMLNADLLKWQYARCLALYRASSDPFTSSTNAPLLSNSIMQSHPVHCLLPVSNALLWAVDCAGINSDSAKSHMSQIACLTGNTVPALTFSTFIVFSVRCFCDSPGSTVSDASEEVETQFIQTVRNMLQTFSASLSTVQQTLRMKLLRPLFGKVEDLVKDPLGDADVAGLVTAALGVYNAQHLNTASSVTVASSKAAPGDGRIPPRPPSVFWDAPRFVQICRDLGLLCSRRWSVALCWDAYGVCLREEGASGVDLWEESVVPPVPAKASADLARKLIETALLVYLSQQSDRVADRAVVDAELVSMYYKSVAPMLCANNDSRRLALNDASKSTSADGLRFEDLLRYGGSATMESLSHARRFLQLAYYDLVVKALPTLMDLTGKSLLSPAPGGMLLVGEAPLSSVCRLLSCQELVRPSAVAVHAKRSLQCRIRPVFFDRLSAGATVAGPSKLTELVTLSYEEFEELCVRIAFDLWETSTAHLHKENLSNKIVLLSQAHFAGKAVPPVTAKAADVYVEACIESNAEHKRFSELKSGKLNTWGVDFFLPFRTTLEKSFPISADVRAQFEAMVLGESASTVLTDTPNKSITAQAKKPKGSVRFDENHNQVNSLQGSQNDEVMSTIFDKSLQYSVADPAVRRADPRTSTTELPPNLRFFSNSPVTVPGPPSSIPSSPSLPLPRESKESERGSREPSLSPKLHTSQQVISSTTERFLLRQESSEQFVVALDALLVGTKEALWPVYATYCSCGDSLDPGKLSGPNLFTLLSKLGVLTDHTILSDLGILLHQTALHSLSSAPVDALSALYESGDYYDTPSLTFEEFIVFLCAFSQLRFEGVMLTQDMFRKRLTTSQPYYSPSKVPPNASSRHSQLSLPSPTPENWFKQWQEFMGSSASFRRLLLECVLPILSKQTLLAFPEDARLRDRFCCVFSIEVLLAIEGVEGPLQSFFEHERARERQARQASLSLSPTPESAVASQSAKYDVEISAILTALKRINLVPKVMGESQVLQLIKDVLPEETNKRRSGAHVSGQPAAAAVPTAQKNYLLFPQWEWVLSVVAFQAVETAMEQSPTTNDHEKIPALVADVINSIAAAITQN